MSFPKLSSPPTLTDTVAKRLLAEIQEGRAQPGDKLPTETALAEQFGVSRTVIREAVSRLRQDGIVEARQGSGVFVTGATGNRALRIDAAELRSLDAVLHIVELRRALEQRSPRRPRRGARSATWPPSTRRWPRSPRPWPPGGDGVQEDVAFHRSIAHATGNPYFLTTLTFVSQFLVAATRITRGNEARHADQMRAVLQEHAAIVEAIRGQDVEGAREAARVHMINAAKRLSLAHR